MPQAKRSLRIRTKDSWRKILHFNPENKLSGISFNFVQSEKVQENISSIYTESPPNTDANKFSGILVIGVPANVNCYENEDLYMIINLTIDVNNKVPESEIKECIEKVTEKEFSAPTVIKNDTEKILMYWEKPSYSAECIFYQLSADGNDVCGDCIDSFYDGKGNFITVLSDGMGTGHRAAIDGAMASSLFSRLIISGFSFPADKSERIPPG